MQNKAEEEIKKKERNLEKENEGSKENKKKERKRTEI